MSTPSAELLGASSAAPTPTVGGDTPVLHPGDAYEAPPDDTSSSAAELKARIKQHYDVASDYYHSLWGEHIHHSYFKSPEDTKETGQTNLIELLLEISDLPKGARVLDVGCGLGGTSRYLAKNRDCHVTGITISSFQVEKATKLSVAEKYSEAKEGDGNDSPAAIIMSAEGGTVAFRELDAEILHDHFSSQSFDAVWISEALSHFPSKSAFFQNAYQVLQPGGRLIIADWFKAPDLTEKQNQADIRPIEDGMLLPPMCTAQEYVAMAVAAGLKLRKSSNCEEGVKDISCDVARTWDISWDLVASPKLWAFAASQGRDGIAFLQAFRAMRRGYANGTFRYAIMSFEK